MPKIVRPPTQPTDDWHQLQLQLQWPAQKAYELLRPVVLGNRTATQRAHDTGLPRRTIARQSARFDAYGMLRLFAGDPQPKDERWRELPLPMQQAIVDLQTQYADFSTHEIAAICYVQFGRRPSPHTIKRVLAAGPPPSRTSRRFPRYHEIHDPAGRRFAILRLHAAGWCVTAIAAYLETTRPTVYAALRKWVAEKVLDDGSHAPKHPARKVDLKAMNTVRTLQENPELGEFRIHAALKQLGIHLSPRTCGRILAINRQLYGLQKPEPEPKEPQPHPFKAQRRHQYWTVDIRYIDAPLISDKQFYVSMIIENFSRAILASAVDSLT